MLHGKAGVFISYSERHKTRVALPFREHIESLGLLGVLVGELPLPLALDTGPSAKIDYYLNHSQMFVALLTPDDEMAAPGSGPAYRTRQNIVDEIARARERPHLRDRILVFRHQNVEGYSNVNPTFESLNLDDLSTTFATFDRQAREWQILPEAESSAAQGPTAPPAPVEDRAALDEDAPPPRGARRAEGSDALQRLAEAIDAEAGDDLDDWTSLRALVAASASNARRPNAQRLAPTEINRVWAARPPMRLSGDESMLALRTMLADGEPHIVPGWSLQPRRSAEDLHRLICRIAFEDDDNAVRRGAVRLLADAPWRSSDAARVVVVEKLLNPEHAWLHGPVLELLGRHGTARDLDALAEALDRTPDADAVLRVRAVVLLRDRWRDGLKLVTEQPAAMSGPVTDLVVARAAEVSAAAWRRMMRSNAATLRVAAVRVAGKRRTLRKRDALAVMADDADGRVRLAALRVAVDRGWRLTVDEIRAGLRQDEGPTWISDEREALAVEALRRADPDARRAEISWLGTEGRFAYTAEALERWPEMAERVRADLTEGFTRLHDPAREEFAAGMHIELPADVVLPASAEEALRRQSEKTLAQIDGLRDFIEKQYRIGALAALAEHPEPRDRELARAMLGHEDRDIRALAVEILGRIGDPDDVPALVRAARDSYDAQRAAAAEVIVACFADDEASIMALIEDEGGTELAGDLAAASGDQLNAEQLEELLFHESTRVRAAAVDALVRRLSAAQARDVLNRYPVSGRAWYFSVAARMDRALNAPKWLRATR